MKSIHRLIMLVATLPLALVASAASAMRGTLLRELLLWPVAHGLARLREWYLRSALVAWDSPPSDIKELHAATQKAMEALSDGLKRVQDIAEKAREEVRQEGSIHTKTNEKLTELAEETKKHTETVSDIKARMTDLEQKLAKKPGAPDPAEFKTAGQLFVESEEYKSTNYERCRAIDAVKVGPIHSKTALLNAQGQNQPLVPDQRVPGIITPAERRLTIRDLLPQLRTTSNLVQFASESAYTNNAAIQFSSPDSRENVTKAESAFTFTLSNAAVETIAHWIPVSRQLLADAPALQGYIDQRLSYGLKLKEESQVLLGDGQAGSLNGLYTQAASYNRGVSNDTKLDCLLKAILQVSLSEYAATGFVLNPIDWTDIMLLKDTTGRYLFTDPQSMAAPRLWGLPVVPTNSMTQTYFLAGAFAMAAAIWDREDTTVRVLEQHDDFAVKNMVAILVEERMTLTVYRTTAMVKGTLPAIGT